MLFLCATQESPPHTSQCLLASLKVRYLGVINAMLKQRQEHFCSLTSHSVLLVRRAEGAGRGQLTYNGQRGIPYHMASMQKESLQTGGVHWVACHCGGIGRQVVSNCFCIPWFIPYVYFFLLFFSILANIFLISTNEFYFVMISPLSFFFSGLDNPSVLILSSLTHLPVLPPALSQSSGHFQVL